MLINPSLLPQATHSSLSFLASSGLGRSCSGGFVFGADEKPPIQAKVSICARPKLSDCPPPIERPAKARCSRSLSTEYFDSIAGIKSLADHLQTSQRPRRGASLHWLWDDRPLP